MPMSARLPFGRALFGEGKGAFAGILARHQRLALAPVVVPMRVVARDPAIDDTQRDALRRLHRQRRVAGDLLGERDGVPGPAMEACFKDSGAEVVFAATECFV